MSSISVAPITPVTLTPLTFVENWVTVVKAHEKLIIVGVVAFTAFHIYSKSIDAYIGKESAKAQQAAVVVKTDDTATKAVQAQLAALQATVATQTAIIAQQISQRNQSTAQQQTVDKTLPPAELAAHWQALLRITNGIDPTTGQQFTVTQAAAVETVVQLEEVPTLTANVASLQTELTNDATIIGQQQTLIGQLNTDLVDEKKSHVADVNLEKAKAKRSFIHGLKIGSVLGYIAGVATGHYL